jgi:CRISPR-associated protein Csm4
LHWIDPERTFGKDQLGYQNAIKEILWVLQDNGIGGERSSGYGAFQLKTPRTLNAGFDFSIASSAEQLMLLSRYHPKPEEISTNIKSAISAYRLTTVRGWAHTVFGADKRRKRLKMIEEGSFIAKGQEGVLGDIVDLKPERLSSGQNQDQNENKDLDGSQDEDNKTFPHPVYRYGLGLGIKWPNTSQEEHS